MSNNPLNLVLRFILELVGLYAFAYWGSTQFDGALGWLIGLGLPVLMAVIWGTFRVPNDPKHAPVPVAGWVRLSIEAGFFGLAVVLWHQAGQPASALTFGAVVIVHYLLAYDRVRWLLSGTPSA